MLCYNNSIPFGRLRQLGPCTCHVLITLDRGVPTKSSNESRCAWFFFWLAEVLNGIPQESVLRLLLFLIFVNDIPDWIRTNVRMFADMKILTRIQNTEDSRILRKTWIVLLTGQKSGCWNSIRISARLCILNMTLIQATKGRNFTLDNITEEKDLKRTQPLTLSQKQCIKSAEKAMSVLGMMKRTFGMVDHEHFMLLNKTYERPHLEFAYRLGHLIRRGISNVQKKFSAGQHQWLLAWGMSHMK